MMAANNKPSIRTPGRTPPFILIGLLLLMGILGYNYWSLWNANAALSSELDVVRIQKKDGDQLIVESEKKLANAKGGIIEARENINQLKKQLQSKESDLAGVKTDLNNKQADVDKYKNEKGQCDSNVVQLKGQVETLEKEKVDSQKLLEEAKAKPTVCDLVSCKAPVRDILAVAAKLVGSNVMSKALLEANLDGPSLLEGIQFPPPVAQTSKVEFSKAEGLKEQQQAANKADQGKAH